MNVMKSFTITTAKGTTYDVLEMKGTPNAYEIYKDGENCPFFMGSKGQWSTADFAPPFPDFNIDEIGKLIEFELKLKS
jgi:hypothetical protein